MPSFEYKTVALPRSVAKRRKRRQSEADMIAEQLGKVLNDEAVDGWEYVRAETLTTPGQKGLLKQATPAAYVVLIFKRSRDAMWQGHEDSAHAATAQRAPAPAPVQHAAPAPSPMVAPVVPVAPVQAVPQDMRFGSTSGQLVSGGDGASVTPMRPLGSAQD